MRREFVFFCFFSVMTLLGLTYWNSKFIYGFYFILPILVFGFYDYFQTKHAIKRNFPILGRFRYWLEAIRPEIQQYFVENNTDGRPYTREQRSLVYQRAKNNVDTLPFGTQKDVYDVGYEWVKHSIKPTKVNSELLRVKIGGETCKQPYDASIFNIAAMSFGSLSAAAVEAMNKGVAKADAYHNTGEGGLSPYHKQGGDVIFHFGTGYFGVRSPEGSLSVDKLVALVENNPCIKAIEIKLSQGAKPGKGGVLPGAKITAEIAEIRGVEIGKDVLSPSTHKAFDTVEELMELIEVIADKTGLPVGIKGAIGKIDQWRALADIMVETGKGPDFITVDGGEGGTGAAPPSFADHVSLPWVYGFSSLYKVFQKRNLVDRIVFVGSGKLGFPAKAAMAFAMGVDCINVAREAMMSIGCIQAQICHTNKCPAGIATQSKWRQSGISVPLKSDRLAQYFKTFRKELVEITHAAGYEHPCQFNMHDIQVNVDDNDLTRNLRTTYGYNKSEVAFESMQHLINCEYLGGKNFSESV